MIAVLILIVVPRPRPRPQHRQSIALAAKWAVYFAQGPELVQIQDSRVHWAHLTFLTEQLNALLAAVFKTFSKCPTV